ncbi:DUF2953 domain-containing protein [Desulfotomaculum copahuensis]|nr:DUF2953 domain-containing protein [Desulfotomaculum copahuensis]
MVSLFVLLWVLLVPVVLLLLLAALPLTLQVSYQRRGHDDRLELNLKIWPGLGYQLALPAIDLARRFSRPAIKLRARLEGRAGPPPAMEKKCLTRPDLPVLLRQARRWLRLGKRLWPAVRCLLRQVQPRRVRWRTLIGLSDAAATGLATGGLWSLKGTAVTALYRFLRPSPVRPELVVMPSFTTPVLAVDLDCIFTVRTGHIMIAALRMAVLYMLGGIQDRLAGHKLPKG